MPPLRGRRRRPAPGSSPGPRPRRPRTPPRRAHARSDGLTSRSQHVWPGEPRARSPRADASAAPSSRAARAWLAADTGRPGQLLQRVAAMPRPSPSPGERSGSPRRGPRPRRVVAELRDACQESGGTHGCPMRSPRCRNSSQRLLAQGARPVEVAAQRDARAEVVERRAPSGSDVAGLAASARHSSQCAAAPLVVALADARPAPQSCSAVRECSAVADLAAEREALLARALVACS